MPYLGAMVVFLVNMRTEFQRDFWHFYTVVHQKRGIFNIPHRGKNYAFSKMVLIF